MCDVMKERIREDRFDLARESIAEGELTYEQIAKAFKLPLSDVEKLAEEMKNQPKTE